MRTREPFLILRLWAFALTLLVASCTPNGSEVSPIRPTDTPIVPGYLKQPRRFQVIRQAAENRVRLVAQPGSVEINDPQLNEVYVEIWNTTIETLRKIQTNKSGSQSMGSGTHLASLAVSSPGAIDAEFELPPNSTYILLYVTDVQYSQRIYFDPQSNENRTTAAYSQVTAEGITPPSDVFEFGGLEGRGLWTSSNEMKSLPTAGLAWDSIVAAAQNDISKPDIDQWDNDSDTNTLAAALMYTRDPVANVAQKARVQQALNKLATTRPTNGAESWGVNILSFVLAADLIRYRTPNFETFLKYLVDNGGTAKQSSLSAFIRQYNQHPRRMNALASLGAIYGYLGDKKKLEELANIWKQLISGIRPAGFMPFRFMTWQADSNKPAMINPKGATKLCGGDLINVDGLLPEEMADSGVCQKVPATDRSVFDTLQGAVTFARIMERNGIFLWDYGDKAIYRAYVALDKLGWIENVLSLDHSWTLAFIDDKNGSNFRCKILPEKRWGGGRSSGFGYILGAIASKPCP